MPILSPETAQRLCYSENTFNRGVQYYKNGKVQTITPKSTPDSVSYHAKIKGSGYISYNTVVELSKANNSIKYVNCDCPAFSEYQGICKHLVALMLTLHEEITGISYANKTVREKMVFTLNEQKRTEPAANMLLRGFEKQTLRKVEQSIASGDIQFVSELNFYNGTPYLTFSIGRDRFYIIRNLSDFLSALSNFEIVSYGKHLSFFHTIEQFTPESQKLVRFVENGFSRSTAAKYSGSVPYSIVQRTMVLTPDLLDEFFHLYESEKISFTYDSSPTKVLIEKGVPKFPLFIEETENDGYALRLEKYVDVLYGQSYLYVYDIDKIYISSKNYYNDTHNLWRAFQKAKTENVLEFSKKDMPSFCANVLPSIKNHFDMRIMCQLDELMPPPFSADFYLDIDEVSNITGRLEFTYGDKTHIAFQPRPDNITSNLAFERHLEQTIKKYFNAIAPSGLAVIYADNEDKIYELAINGVNIIAQLCNVFTSESFNSIKIKPFATATVGVRVEAGLLHLQMDLGDFDKAELESVFTAYRKNKKYYRLKDGSFINLEEGAISQLSRLTQDLRISAKDLEKGEVTLKNYYTLYLDQLLKQSTDLVYNRNSQFKEIVRNIHNVQETEFALPSQLKKVLRNYQKTGYRWMRTMGSYGFGGILADDMGLGKTLQVLSVLHAHYTMENANLPSLVVCPSSLVLNWQSEIEKFAPNLKCVVLQGSAEMRKQALEEISTAQIALTSYDLLKRDIELYEHIRFLYVVADEAQYMKNKNTQNARAIKAINANYRLALTGTPIENSLAELWSIFDFLMPGYLYHYAQFRKDFELPIVKQNDEKASKRLHKMVSPFILRRMKTEVLHELPDKTETVMCASLQPQQRKIYAAHALKAQQAIESGLGDSGADKIQILALLTRLRQICCDPTLVFENYTDGSAKLELCMELIHDCINSNHRILLFSQFTSMLEIIAKRLRKDNIPYYMLTGETKPADRLELVNNFNADATPVFLISLRAGGTGLNLTGADTVIHYDPWWNVSAQNQASDRAHRIGQTKKVQVYKLIVAGTVEERIVKMQERKSEIANIVMAENTGAFSQLTKEDLAQLFSTEVQNT